MVINIAALKVASKTLRPYVAAFPRSPLHHSEDHLWYSHRFRDYLYRIYSLIRRLAYKTTPPLETPNSGITHRPSYKTTLLRTNLRANLSHLSRSCDGDLGTYQLHFCTSNHLSHLFFAAFWLIPLFTSAP